MAPIRVGFIGLSKSGWALNAHLPYLKASDKFEIVAIQNSSVESAQEAIETHGLPASTKAYGDPQDLANDPNVDLVVCSVRVDRHKATIVPSLKAGKDVYVEWPLGKSLADAEEILSFKNPSAKGVVGLQARQAPIIAKIKDVIAKGTIGDVLSSTWVAAAGNGGATTNENYAYLGDKKVGGNLVTIHTGHAVDYVQQALGSTFTSSTAVLANRRPFVTLTKDDGTVITDKHPKTAEDTIFIQGTLGSSVPVQVSLRGGSTFKGTPGLDWRIYGTKGELRITAAGPFLQIGYPDQKIELHDVATDSVSVLDVLTDRWDDLPLPGRNVARVYEAIAGDAGRQELLCSFEDAVERHRFLHKLDQ
ncbi:oxidoreductase family protein [Phlyctema vagabunda]|uniref:Oxidoreductase family protein n=1 Tax=Phlyctema vagabunda TaxID=108571 RepID=A0ABR4P2T1_9HELO